MSQQFLVTGASGYISSWVCRYLIEDGHIVHATVRDASNNEKCSYLNTLKQEYPNQIHIFEADLLQQDAFINAIEGCHYVLHMASPFTIKFKDAEKDLVQPAVEGTRNVLTAAKNTHCVKRVVVTSSIAAIMGDAQDAVDIGGTIDESHWNITSHSNHQPYCYSKTEAEKAAWQIAQTQTQWDLVTINPGFVFGPSLTKRIDSTSIGFIRDMLRGAFPLIPDVSYACVDVRDVARAHISAALTEHAHGRYITANKVLSFIDISKLQ